MHKFSTTERKLNTAATKNGCPAKKSYQELNVLLRGGGRRKKKNSKSKSLAIISIKVSVHVSTVRHWIRMLMEEHWFYTKYIIKNKNKTPNVCCTSHLCKSLALVPQQLVVLWTDEKCSWENCTTLCILINWLIFKNTAGKHKNILPTVKHSAGCILFWGCMLEWTSLTDNFVNCINNSCRRISGQQSLEAEIKLFEKKNIVFQNGNWHAAVWSEEGCSPKILQKYRWTKTL